MYQTFIRFYAPDFCYVTSRDLYRMARIFYKGIDIDIYDFRKAIQHAKSKGILKSVKDKNGERGNNKVFIRIK